MSSTLAPARQVGLDSPGSSIFDLPSTANPRPSSSRAQGVNTEIPDSDDISEPSFLVVSGGTGCNAICSAFGQNACYVLPVSDDGGSSSEIIRVIGGPSIGDIRSRLVRLIPPAPPGSSLDAIRGLLEHRLSADEHEARQRWREIVEGHSDLWSGIPNDRKETIRGFLVYFESELLRRAHKSFSFLNGSVGNFFIAATTSFFRSLPSAIFLFSSITQSQANILPVIVTNHTVTIAAELEDQTHLIGQCEISHPVRRPPSINVTNTDDTSGDDDASDTDSVASKDTEDGISARTGSRANINFQQSSKEEYIPLSARISRIYYINAYGQEIHPSPNPDFLSVIRSRDVLVYSCGSLWTSIMPCLALRGVGEAIAKSQSLKAKVLLLNAQNDRETEDYSAADYIDAIVTTLCARYRPRNDGKSGATSQFAAMADYPTSAFVTHLVYLEESSVQVDVDTVTMMGVKCVAVSGNNGKFDAASTREGLDRILAEC